MNQLSSPMNQLTPAQYTPATIVTVDDKNKKRNIIIGVSVGLIVLLIIIAIIIFVVMKKKTVEIDTL